MNTVPTRVSSFQYAGDPTGRPAQNPTPVIIARLESAQGHAWTAEVRFPGEAGDLAADLFFAVLETLPRRPLRVRLFELPPPDSFYLADADTQALTAKDFGCYTFAPGATEHRPSDAWNAA